MPQDTEIEDELARGELGYLTAAQQLDWEGRSEAGANKGAARYRDDGREQDKRRQGADMGVECIAVQLSLTGSAMSRAGDSLLLVGSWGLEGAPECPETREGLQRGVTTASRSTLLSVDFRFPPLQPRSACETSRRASLPSPRRTSSSSAMCGISTVVSLSSFRT